MEKKLHCNRVISVIIMAPSVSRQVYGSSPTPILILHTFTPSSSCYELNLKEDTPQRLSHDKRRKRIMTTGANYDIRNQSKHYGRRFSIHTQ